MRGLSSYPRGNPSLGRARSGGQGPGVKGHRPFWPGAAPAVRALLMAVLFFAEPAGSGPQLDAFPGSGVQPGVFGVPWPGE